MHPQIKALVLYVIVPYLIFAAGLIGLFLYKTRARSLPVTLTHGSGEASISIDCTEKLNAEFARKLKWLSPLYPSLVLLGVYLFVMINLGLSHGSLSDLLDPKSRLFSVGIILLVLMSTGGWLGTCVGQERSKPLFDAYRLCRGKPQIFRADSTGIWIPTLLLIYPAIWRTAEKSMTELFVPYEDIERFEIYDRAGNSPDQYKLIVHGPSAEYGLGRLGQADFIQFGVCMKRAPLRNQEARILAFLNDQLGHRLVTCTDNIA